jgi:hypothetical protein
MQYVFDRAFIDERDRRLRSIGGRRRVRREELAQRGVETVGGSRTLRFGVDWMA